MLELNSTDRFSRESLFLFIILINFIISNYFWVYNWFNFIIWLHDMLVIADGFRLLLLLFLLWYHFLIFGKLTRIDLVQIWIALVPKGTGSVPQSMEKRNWNRSKRNWEIPISDQIGSGDGWSSTCTIETGWRWSRTVFPILNNQYIRRF